MSRGLGDVYKRQIIRYDRLVGDAEDSPIVDDGGSRDQFTGGVSVAYQF